jgi:hypothetical protein
MYENLVKINISKIAIGGLICIVELIRHISFKSLLTMMQRKSLWYELYYVYNNLFHSFFRASVDHEMKITKQIYQKYQKQYTIIEVLIAKQ